MRRVKMEIREQQGTVYCEECSKFYERQKGITITVHLPVAGVIVGVTERIYLCLTCAQELSQELLQTLATITVSNPPEEDKAYDRNDPL